MTYFLFTVSAQFSIVSRIALSFSILTFAHGTAIPEGSSHNILNQQWQGACDQLDGLVCGHDIDHFCEVETDWCIKCAVYCDEKGGYYYDKMCRNKCPAWYAVHHPPIISTQMAPTKLLKASTTFFTKGEQKNERGLNIITPMHILDIPIAANKGDAYKTPGSSDIGYTMLYCSAGVAAAILTGIIIIFLNIRFKNSKSYPSCHMSVNQFQTEIHLPASRSTCNTSEGLISRYNINGIAPPPNPGGGPTSQPVLDDNETFDGVPLIVKYPGIQPGQKDLITPLALIDKPASETLFLFSSV